MLRIIYVLLTNQIQLFMRLAVLKGWKSFEKTISYLNENYPEIFTIADAKRGDIGNTSRMYAKAFFQDYGV